MKHYLLKVWYIGTNFHGSQRQPNKRTVEGELIRVLILTGYIKNARENIFKAVARTDKGVHAREAGFSFFSNSKLYIHRINDNLEKDIGITAWAEIPQDYKPRYRCASKEYHYFLSEFGFDKGYIEKNITLIEDSIKILQGRHDFTLFYKKNPSFDRSPIVDIDNIRYNLLDGGIEFIFEAKSFLWEQIRRIIRFIEKILAKKFSPEDLKKHLEPNFIHQAHRHKIQPSNSDGLTLWKLNFEENLFFKQDKKLKTRNQQKLKDIMIVRNQQTHSIKKIYE